MHSIYSHRIDGAFILTKLDKNYCVCPRLEFVMSTAIVMNVNFDKMTEKIYRKISLGTINNNSII